MSKDIKPLVDVTTDNEKRAAAEKFLKPIEVDAKKAPESLRCPLSKLIFADPVSTDVAEDQSSEIYEREKIAAWLETKGTDPVNQQTLASKKLTKDSRTLRDVKAFLDQNPMFRDSDQLYLPRSLVTRLETACQQGDIKTIQLLAEQDKRLLSWTFDFEGESYEGKKILHLACQTGVKVAVEELLRLAEARAEGLGLLLLLQEDKSGKTPLQYALEKDPQSELSVYLTQIMGADAEKISKKTRRDQLKQSTLTGEQPGEKVPAQLLLQMEEITEQLQELKKTVENQGKIIQGQQQLIEQMSASLPAHPTPSGFLREDPKVPGYFRYPEKLRMTPQEFRRTLIDDLPSYPLASQISGYLNREQKEVKEEKEFKLVGHKGAIKAMAYLQVDDDKYVLVSLSAAEGAARIWDVETQSCLMVLEDKCSEFSAPPISLYPRIKNRIAFASRNNAGINAVSIWDIEPKKRIVNLVTLNQVSSFFSLSFNHQYDLYAVFSRYIFRTDVDNDENCKFENYTTPLEITAIIFPEVGILSNYTVIGYVDHSIKVYNSYSSVNGKESIALKGHEGPVRGLLALPGNRLISSADDYTIKIWNMTQLTCETLLVMNTFSNWSVLFDGRIRGDNTVWEDIGNMTNRYDGYYTILNNGKILYSGNSDYSITKYRQLLPLKSFTIIDLNFRMELITAKAQVRADEKTILVSTEKLARQNLASLSKALQAVGIQYNHDEKEKAECKEKGRSNSLHAIGVSDEKGTQLTIKTTNLRFEGEGSAQEVAALCQVFSSRQSAAALRKSGLFSTTASAVSSSSSSSSSSMTTSVSTSSSYSPTSTST